MSEPVFDLLLGAIASQGLDYQEDRKQGGLRVWVRGTRLIVQRLNRHGIPVRLRPTDRALLEAFALEFAPFTTLGAMFGYSETLRRQQALHGIAKREAAGRIFGLESLDEKAPRMLTVEEIARANPDDLPRWYTFVTENPPARHVVFREMPFKGGAVRPDEIAASWDISHGELEKAKAGVSFEEVRRTVPGAAEPRNMRVTSGDPNRPIKGKLIVDHYLKNLKGGKAALQTLIKRFNLRPKGTVLIEFREVYVEALAVIFRPTDDGWRAGTIRPAAESAERRLLISTRVALKQRAGDWTGAVQHRDSGISDPKIQQRVAGLARQVVGPLQQLLRHANSLRPRR